jgi:hypothetical protein
MTVSSSNAAGNKDTGADGASAALAEISPLDLVLKRRQRLGNGSS